MASRSLYTNPNTGDATFAGNVTSANTGMFRNKIINGNFDFWQRGTSFNVTAASTFTADRWVINYDGTGATRTVTQQAFTLGQTDVPNNPMYFIRYNQSVAGSSGTFNTLAQRIEGVRTLAGQTVTLSFYGKSDATRSITPFFIQVFGTGGTPSSAVFTNFPLISLGTTWAKYVTTITIPSINGKTIGTNNRDYLELSLSIPLNTTFTIDLAQVQLEQGSIATPFEVRPPGVELALCQRYYEVGLTEFASGLNTGNYRAISVQFKVTKYVNPTCTLLSDSGYTSTLDTSTKTNINQVTYYNMGGNSISNTWAANSEI
jgi:hypothetical protein